ncbi:MAG: hypothetical protein FJ272_23245, partial [Planctomycetes bacterium]|nr:hypothetical protein [Planctomycetota bacterium]
MSPTEPSSAKHQRPSVEKELFLSPPNDCRPAPFWSINDLLDPAEVRRQVREFARVGYGGWFFHARVGIATRYLSADWMDAFAAALDEGKQHGHLCWLYDEDSYPSGFAGGLVLREHPEFRGKAIKMAQGEPPAGCRVMARFAVKGGTSVPLVRSLAGARRLREGEPPAQGEQLLTFYEALYPTGGWFNGGSYIDALNPSAIDAFLRSTHDRYAERFRAEFGQSIPGIFTDEPHIQPMTGPFSVTWTDDFDAEFQRQHGYSLLDRLPALFFTMPDSGRVRTDYWQTLARRFQTACIGRMAEWCERHGLALTGHCWEHGFPQAGHAGSFNFAEIPMQWPGIDLLFGNTEKGRLLGRLQGQVGRMTVVKSISGLAHQFGRPRIMSETYGGAGWEATFRDLKEIL